MSGAKQMLGELLVDAVNSHPWSSPFYSSHKPISTKRKGSAGSMSNMSQSPTPPSSDGPSSACGGLSSAATSPGSSDTEAEMPVSPPTINGIVTRCTLCQETFTCPKVLSCFHTFCQPCLEKAIPETAQRIRCPTCSEDTYLPNGLAGLVSDYAVSNILEANALEGTNHLQCTGCKNKEMTATSRCFDCANFLCGNCVMAHQFMHCFEGHRVIDLNQLQNKDEKRIEKPIMCSRHKKQVLCFFCRTCNTPICQDCTVIEHARGHEFVLINECLGRDVEMIRQLGEQARVKATDLRGSAKNVKHSTNHLQGLYKKACNEINSTFSFYTTQLEERRNEAMKELESAYNTKQVALSTTTQKMQEVIENLYHSAEFVDKVVKHAGMTETLMLKNVVETKLSSAMAYSPDVNLSNATEIEFISNYQAIQVGVRNTFGYVRQTPDENKIQPIARPNPLSRLPAPSSPPMMSVPMPVATSASTTLSNGFSHLTNGSFDTFSTSNMLSMKQNFPSNSSISTMQSTNTADSLGLSQQYKEWSNADFYQSQQVANVPTSTTTDIFSTCNDPIMEITSKMFNANIYPPKSQIKRQKMIYHCKFGEFGVSEGQFTEPSGVAVNAQNDIIVADTNNHRIQIFDREGRFKFQFGECGKRDGQLLYPNRVAVVKNSGDIVVTERSPTHQVQVYNQYGQFVRKFGANILQHPRGVTVDNKGRIIIVECKVMRVIIFDQMGNQLSKFNCSRHLEFPNGVVVNDCEEIFISDNRAHCVKVFNYHGQYLRQIGGEGITNYPIGVGINSNGEVLIADNHNNFNLTVFTQDGQLVNALESKVKHAQCFDVSLMIDDASIVLASKDYRLYIYRYAQSQPQMPQLSQLAGHM